MRACILRFKDNVLFHSEILLQARLPACQSLDRQSVTLHLLVFPVRFQNLRRPVTTLPTQASPADTSDWIRSYVNIVLCHVRVAMLLHLVRQAVARVDSPGGQPLVDANCLSDLAESLAVLSDEHQPQMDRSCGEASI